MSAAGTSVLAGASAELANSLIDGRRPDHEGGNHANDKRYHDLRDQARQYWSKHQHFASEASGAYKSGHKKDAGSLSQQSKHYEALANQVNEEAAVYVLRANNTDSNVDEIDLHGLFVKEAVVAFDAYLTVSQQRQRQVVKAIVGKGLHAQNHIATLRPAILAHCQQRGIPVNVDKHNSGVVIAHIARANSNGQPPQAPQQPVQHGYYPPTYQQGQQQGYQQGYAAEPSEDTSAFASSQNPTTPRDICLLIVRLCF